MNSAMFIIIILGGLKLGGIKLKSFPRLCVRPNGETSVPSEVVVFR